MSNLFSENQEDSPSVPLLLKIKDALEFKLPTAIRPAFELPIKQKTLISYKSRYLRIYDKFLLLFKSKSSPRPSSVIYIDDELKLEWLHNFGFKLIKNYECVEFYLCELKDSGQLARALNLRCNLLNFHGTYKAIKKIGKGSFASVYLVVRKDDSERKFAVKSFNKDHIAQQNKGKDALLNEIKIMRTLQHTNIIALNEVYETENSYYMIMELLEGGSLKDRLEKGKLDNKAVFSVMKGTLQGLCSMHQRGIMHRDLKPENILFRRNGNKEEDVCIADFGLATEVKETTYLFSRCGTPGFVAPEIINLKDERTAQYSEKCDIFSLGIIYHLFPFEGNKYKTVLLQNKACKFEFQSSFYDTIASREKILLMRMLELSPEKRFSAEEALSSLIALNAPESPGLATSNKEQTSSEEKENSQKQDQAVVSPSQTPCLTKKKSGGVSDYADSEEKSQSTFVMRTTIMNGHCNTIDGLPVCAETEEKHTKLKRGLSIKIYRFPTIDIQSPNFLASLDSPCKNEEKKTPETLPEPTCVNHLLSIKENDEEEEKKNL